MVEIYDSKEVWVNGTRVGFISDNRWFYPFPGVRLYAVELIEIANTMAKLAITPGIVDQATIDKAVEQEKERATHWADEQARDRLQRQAPRITEKLSDHVSRSLHPDGD